MVDIILNYLSFILDARYYLRARDAVNAYTRENHNVGHVVAPLNSWNEFFESEIEAKKSIMKAIITGHMLSTEEVENIIRAATWYKTHKKNEQ